MDKVATEHCAFHAMFPDAPAGGGSAGGAAHPTLAEVEKGHFVACFRLDEPGTC